jgi:two-component system response regulator HydG
VLNNLDEETSRLREALRDAQENMKRQASEIRDLKQRINVQGEPGIVCRSGSFARVLTLAAKVASSRATVLLQGESGTGKEVVARLIHRHSESAKEPFLAVNCAALPAQLLESELFGHKRGSFTGAESDKKGLFLQAGRGTLLLDEIGEMPLELQAKLLRALQQKEIRPVGGLHDLPVQARIIATANRDLKEMVGEGRFREDLFFRLSVFPITIPPLRERREDILPLAQNFLSRLKPEHPGFSAQAVRLMELYAWPGNVRELENWMEYAVILAGNERITPEHLPLKTDWKDRDLLLLLTSDMPTCEELEKRYIRHVLERTGHNKSEAARILGIGVTTLWRRQKGKRTD